MKIDSGFLDRRFELMGTREAGERITGAFKKRDVQFFIVGEQWQPGQSAVLIERRPFMEELIQTAFGKDSPGWRQDWLEALGREPELLPILIAGGVLKQFPRGNLDPGAAQSVVLLPAQQRAVRSYLKGYLAGVSKTPLIDAMNPSPAQLESPGIAVADGRVLGVYLGPTVGRGGSQGPGSWSYEIPLTVRRTLHEIREEPSPAAAAGAKSSPEVGPVASVTPGAPGVVPEFSAFPRVTVSAAAVPEKPLPFVVGYSESPDPQAQEQTPINVKEPQGDLLVIASAEGATIEEPSFVQLPMQMAAEHTFVANVAKGAEKVVLRVKYFYKNNLVGSIVKPVPLEAASANVAVSLLPRLRLDEAAARVDLILLVERSTPGCIAWSALVPDTGKVSGPFKVELAEEKKFAKDLAGIRRTYGDRGQSALEELYGMGIQIRDLIPKEIRDDYLLPALKGPRPPSILLMTDQAFVPWELARFGPRELGRKEPAFLGELARVGRWWTATSVGAPRSYRKIEQVSAVAATEYKGAGGLQTLPHALAERTWLVTEFQKALKVRPVEATLPEVESWLRSQPPPAGHLGHIALHGYSDAEENAQGLVLGDGRVLTPNLLAGQFYEGDQPRFEVVFLNACQVGTAGERLGRIAGFPGALLRAGAAALIAPLWEVQDSVAGRVAQEFYRRVLVEGLEVAEVMRQLRSDIDRESITPAAYVYYGHPCLQLAH
jgi:hypothetical protein